LTIQFKRNLSEVRKARRIFLVYQNGIANVFAVKSFNLADFGRNATRLLQADHQSCSVYCLGMAQRGAIVRTAACNMTGDITHQHWTEDLGDTINCLMLN